jgi:hypothetical protein
MNNEFYINSFENRDLRRQHKEHTLKIYTMFFLLFSQLQIYLTCAAILTESKTRSLTRVTLKVIVHGVGWPCSVIGHGERHLRARGTR